MYLKSGLPEMMSSLSLPQGMCLIPLRCVSWIALAPRSLVTTSMTERKVLPNHSKWNQATSQPDLDDSFVGRHWHSLSIGYWQRLWFICILCGLFVVYLWFICGLFVVYLWFILWFICGLFVGYFGLFVIYLYLIIICSTRMPKPVCLHQTRKMSGSRP
jgi:hypothetical protein